MVDILVKIGNSASAIPVLVECFENTKKGLDLVSGKIAELAHHLSLGKNVLPTDCSHSLMKG